MGRNQRIGLLVGAVVIVVIAVIVIGGGSDSKTKTASGPQTVTVVNGKPEGGVKTITYKKGDTVDLTVKSDTADEIHIHGYDLHKDVTKGGSVHFTFPASIDGKFVVELEDARRADRVAPGRAVSRRLRAAGAIVLAAALALPATASAHGLVGKQDLPIPRWLFAWGAAIVLVISFVGLAVLWPKPRLEERARAARAAAARPARGSQRADRRRDLRDRRLRGPRRRADLDGEPHADRRLRPVLGRDPRAQPAVRRRVPAVQPVARDRPRDGLARKRIGAGADPLPYPSGSAAGPRRSGSSRSRGSSSRTSNKADPSTLSIMILAYAAAQIVGMSVYGTEAWSRYGDAFGVTSAFSRGCRRCTGSAASCGGGCRWAARRSWTRCREPSPLLCTMIGTTSFDGFSQGPLWTGPTGSASSSQHRFLDLGFNAEIALEIAFTIGLVGVVLIMNGLYRLGVIGMRSVGENHHGDRARGGASCTR